MNELPHEKLKLPLLTKKYWSENIPVSVKYILETDPERVFWFSTAVVIYNTLLLLYDNEVQKPLINELCAYILEVSFSKCKTNNNIKRKLYSTDILIQFCNESARVKLEEAPNDFKLFLQKLNKLCFNVVNDNSFIEDIDREFKYEDFRSWPGKLSAYTWIWLHIILSKKIIKNDRFFLKFIIDKLDVIIACTDCRQHYIQHKASSLKTATQIYPYVHRPDLYFIALHYSLRIDTILEEFELKSENINDLKIIKKVHEISKEYELIQKYALE